MKEPYEEYSVINKIFTIRERKVMLDADLAELYDVTSKRLNEQVKRNLDRFPGDFMFQLSDQEFDNLRSHFATSSHGGRRYNPYVFTEHGVLMLSSVLRSKRAIEVNILIMRVFIKMRRNLELQRDLLKRIDQITDKVSGHDQQIKKLFLYVQSLTKDNHTKERPQIGYKK